MIFYGFTGEMRTRREGLVITTCSTLSQGFNEA